VAAHDVAQPRDVVHVALDELGIAGRGAVPGRQVVVGDDAAAGARQQPGRVAADVAGAAGDENGSQGYLPIEK
jgi:hypothetical protein